MISADIDTLTARFCDHFTCDLPITFDNQPLEDYPNGRVHFSVKPGASRHLYGDRISGAYKQQGRVWLYVYLPDQQGTGEATAILDSFAPIFRNWTNDAIRCETEDTGPTQTINGQVRFSMSIFYESVRPYTPKS